VPPELYFFY